MLIPITSTDKVTPETYAIETEIDLHMIDTGLDFRLTRADHATGCAYFHMERAGHPRGWKIIMCVDGSGILHHARYGTHQHPSCGSLHTALKDLVEQGYD